MPSLKQYMHIAHYSQAFWGRELRQERVGNDLWRTDVLVGRKLTAFGLVASSVFAFWQGGGSGLFALGGGVGAVEVVYRIVEEAFGDEEGGDDGEAALEP